MGQGNLLVLDHNDDPEVVFRMLTWMYVADYDDGPPEAAISGGSIPASPGAMQPHLIQAVNNIDVYCMAEKYEIEDLQSKATDKCLAQPWTLWTLDELTVLVKKLYPAAPGSCKELRKKLISACADQIPGFFVTANQTCAIANVGNFATDLSQEVQIREFEAENDQLKDQNASLRWDTFHLRRNMSEVVAQRDHALQLLNQVIQPLPNNTYEASGQCYDGCPLNRPPCILPRSHICRTCYPA